ncbi:uracil-DNA glycosylase, family 4 [Herbaspirillum sp. CF444]|uniref:uracil-DNA glycosylase n=1 Tax=Herbaspirillum sp. CF444 TaxID=1144319 RepID=UPI0002726E00|nr:uracil-DNA glycosylase [Herbaspirillum sp. CF444]EJL93787.1 uracil-DNA glycosylase, family 4 [Herbaspirillum sp. CF444]
MSLHTLAASARVLEEIGVGPVWVRRHLPADAAATQDLEPAQAAPLESVPAAPATSAAVSAAASPERVISSRRDAAPAQAASPAADDGLPPWLSEMDGADMVSGGFMPYDDEEDDAPIVKIDPAIATMDWGKLKETVADCRQCGLCKGRKKTVFGVGDEKAKWLFIGEGPGRNEDIQGEPFVGPAGKLLDNMLVAMGLKRGDNAYIANIVKCRPTDENGKDRPPSPQEVASCMPYLQRQIDLIQPTVLVALGKTAALSLLGLDPATPVSKLRGTVHRYRDLPLVVTYHPAYLLRQLGDKSKAWADLCLAMSTYADTAN